MDGLQFPFGTYVTYPHSNGFTADGRYLLLGWLDDSRAGIQKVDLSSGEITPLWEVPTSPPRGLWFDLALEADVLVAVYSNVVWLLDLDPNQEPRCLYEPPEGRVLQELVSVNRAGTRALVGFNAPGEHGCLEIDLALGTSRVLFTKDWHANHFHYCPHDEQWIGFAHEGPTRQIPDRTWAWHAELAPEGKCVFNQQVPGGQLSVGHERWAFHDTCAVTIAYGESLAGPRGLYEVFADARPPRLVSEADRDFHCDITRDGRWAVVDTTGPSDAPGIGWENAGRINDIILVDMTTGERRRLARTGELAHRAERGPEHPYHPHPAFSPDGKSVVFNDWVEDGARVVPAARQLFLD